MDFCPRFSSVFGGVLLIATLPFAAQAQPSNSALANEIQQKLRKSAYDSCYSKVKDLSNQHKQTFQAAGYCACATEKVTLNDAELAAAVRGEVAPTVREKYIVEAQRCLPNYR